MTNQADIVIDALAEIASLVRSDLPGRLLDASLDELPAIMAETMVAVATLEDAAARCADDVARAVPMTDEQRETLETALLMLSGSGDLEHHLRRAGRRV